MEAPGEVGVLVAGVEEGASDRGRVERAASVPSLAPQCLEGLAAPPFAEPHRRRPGALARAVGPAAATSIAARHSLRRSNYSKASEGRRLLSEPSALQAHARPWSL